MNKELKYRSVPYRVGVQLNITPHIHYDVHLSDMAKGPVTFARKVLAAAKILVENLAFQLEQLPGAPRAPEIYQIIADDLRKGKYMTPSTINLLHKDITLYSSKTCPPTGSPTIWQAISGIYF